MAGEASRLTLTDYQYNLYNDYLTQLDEMLIKYGKQTGMSIQYWHIRVDDSMNYDDLKIQNSYRHYVYDIYHFVPTINMTPLTYQIGYNPQYQGTSNVGTGSFSMYLIDKPLPGDLFKFYSDQDQTDAEEIFRITNVRYMRTAKNKLKLYQLDFETAPILLSTLDHVRINLILCWDTESFKFLDEEQCHAMEEIQEKRDELVDEINKYYDELHGWYGRCFVRDEQGNDVGKICSPDHYIRPLVFLNTIIKRLKYKFDALDIKPIYGIGTARISLNWMLRPGDYWDTFTCLSFQPDANGGEIFNVTRILDGACEACPQELIDEIECYRHLIELVRELLELLAPLMTEEELNDDTCDRNCCDATDPNYIYQCLITDKEHFNDLFWDYQGSDADANAPEFCMQYENAACIPLYISWKDGAQWPDGGITQ
jgi:hypothetical protein